MPPPVRSAEREGRSNHCERRRRARMPIPSADGSAGAVRIFYCIRGGTEHNVRDNDVCVRCENKRGEPPNCCGRKCYERGCCGQRRRGRRRRARTRIRQVQFVYFIVFGSRRRITFGAMDRAPAGKRKRGAVSAPIRRSWEPLHGNCPAPLSPCSQYASRT